MRPLHRVAIAALLVLVVAAIGTVVLAQKGKPQPPPIPQVPLALVDGLNVVTIELSKTLRVWDPGQNPIDEIWAQLRTDAVQGVLLADVDGIPNSEGEYESELVRPGACQDTAGVVYVWLAAYKRNQPGELYSGKCDPLQRVAAGPIDPEIVGYDLDGLSNRREEVVLKTRTDLVVFGLLDNGSWKPRAHKALSTVIADSGLQVPPGANFLARSLAVGDVDGDSEAEIVTTLDYYYPRPEVRDGYHGSRTFLLVFSSSLELESWIEFDHATITLPDFCVGYRAAVHLADTDGNGRPEIWLAGWTNTASSYAYEQHVLSFRVDAGSLVREAHWYFGLSDRLGPYIATGHLWNSTGGGTRDQVLLSEFAHGDDSIKIYQPDGDYQPTLLSSVDAPGALSRAFILDGQLVIGGLVPGAKRLKKGLFLQRLVPVSVDNPVEGLTSLAFYFVRDDSEIWTMTVGKGVK